MFHKRVVFNGGGWGQHSSTLLQGAKINDSLGPPDVRPPGYAPGGKSPVGAYKTVEALQFFSCFENNSYRIIKKGWNIDLVDISSVWQFIWQQLTTILLVYHFIDLADQDAYGSGTCETIRISNLHCALHTHMLTNATSVVTFEIGIIPW